MLKLLMVDWGQFDLAFDDPAADDAAAAVATLVYAVLYSDARAPADVEPDAFQQRGWWADPERGTGLWYVRRQALDDAARRESLAMVRNALINRDPALTDVEVTETIPTDAAGNVSSVVLSVSGFHNGRQFLVKVPL